MALSSESRSPGILALWGRKRFSIWGAVLGYCALIFFLSSQQDLTVPEVFSATDKIAHLLEYGGLGWLCARAARAEWPGWTNLAVVLVTLLFAGVYGASDEWHQLYVPGRFAELSDLLADVGGGTSGGIGYLLWLRSGEHSGRAGRKPIAGELPR